jgi:hypothetical protein
VQEAVRLARQVRNAPKLSLQVDRLSLTRSQLGFVNETTTPSYRLFMSDADLELHNLSNQVGHGSSKFLARGAFMGSGATVVSGEFQAAASEADFAVKLHLDDARLTDLNDFLRANARLDVADGLFSVYSEVTVKNGQVDGYIKPLVKNLQISQKAKDRSKPLGKRVEMHALQILADLFKNHRTQQVATVARISGSTREPHASEWEVIRKLISNGLFRAILPGYQDKGPAPKP